MANPDRPIHLDTTGVSPISVIRRSRVFGASFLKGKFALGTFRHARHRLIFDRFTASLRCNFGRDGERIGGSNGVIEESEGRRRASLRLLAVRPLRAPIDLCAWYSGPGHLLSSHREGCAGEATVHMAVRELGESQSNESVAQLETPFSP